MRIGFVSFWTNRGQAVVTRQVRSIFDNAGYETYVLARPTREFKSILSQVSTEDVWQGANIRIATSFKIPLHEYLNWVNDYSIDIIFFDMNQQFEEILALRKTGVRTVGRFVWERFPVKKVDLVKEAYDTVYSLTRCEQIRYKELGIESPYIRWGVYPDSIVDKSNKRNDGIYFIFHGGNTGPRKPLLETVQAFKEVKNPDIRLIIKCQGTRTDRDIFTLDDDSRIEHIVEDMEYQAYKDLYTSCHISLAPARWEGLGVHLYESLGYGMPVISNNIPPINEVIKHNESGLLVKSIFRSTNRQGLNTYNPDIADLKRCINELSEPGRLKELEVSTKKAAKEFSWGNTESDYLRLVELNKND